MPVTITREIAEAVFADLKPIITKAQELAGKLQTGFNFGAAGDEVEAHLEYHFPHYKDETHLDAFKADLFAAAYLEATPMVMIIHRDHKDIVACGVTECLEFSKRHGPDDYKVVLKPGVNAV